jgi:hypothetical protein
VLWAAHLDIAALKAAVLDRCPSVLVFLQNFQLPEGCKCLDVVVVGSLTHDIRMAPIPARALTSNNYPLTATARGIRNLSAFS